MDPFKELGRNLNQAWSQLTDGGRELLARGSSALIRFFPRRTEGRESGLQNFPQWGVVAAEVIEKDDAVIVRIEVPGIERDDCDIRIEDRTLRVRGEKRIQREHLGDHYYVSECAYGSFERNIPLPAPVEENSAKAALRDGILRIELKKTAARSGTRVPID